VHSRQRRLSKRLKRARREITGQELNGCTRRVEPPAPRRGQCELQRRRILAHVVAALNAKLPTTWRPSAEEGSEPSTLRYSSLARYRYVPDRPVQAGLERGAAGRFAVASCGRDTKAAKLSWASTRQLHARPGAADARVPKMAAPPASSHGEWSTGAGRRGLPARSREEHREARCQVGAAAATDGRRGPRCARSPQAGARPRRGPCLVEVFTR